MYVFTDLSNSYHSQLWNIFLTLERNPMCLAVIPHSLFFPAPQQPLIFLSLWICFFWTLHVNEVMQYVVFSDWLL